MVMEGYLFCDEIIFVDLKVTGEFLWTGDTLLSAIISLEENVLVCAVTENVLSCGSCDTHNIIFCNEQE